MSALPARTLRKKRHLVDADGWHIAVDEFSDGSLLAEIDDGDQPSVGIPDWLDVVCDVSNDETWTGGELAQSTTVARLCHPGVDTNPCRRAECDCAASTRG